MVKDFRILAADAVERVDGAPSAFERQRPFGGLMAVLVPGATSHEDCIEAGWPEWLPHIVTDLYNADVGAANEWSAAYEWGIELAAAIGQPVDYTAARPRFLLKLLQPLTEQSAPVPLKQIVTLLERALTDDPPSSTEWSAARKTIWQAAFDAWDDAKPRQHDIWDAASVTTRNMDHKTEWVADALAWGGDEHRKTARAAQREALVAALLESTMGTPSPLIAGGSPCPCDGRASCDASCECRCAEGFCGDCEPLTGEERGYCSCADGGHCPRETRAAGAHADWLADYDSAALRQHPGIAYPVFTAGYVLPWAEGRAVPWTQAARIAEVGGHGERRRAIIPIWEGALAPAPPTLRPLDQPRVEDTHCLELTRQGLGNLCGFGDVTHPERNVLCGTGAISCRGCRELLMSDSPALAGSATEMIQTGGRKDREDREHTE